jgi:hypothetical protein
VEGTWVDEFTLHFVGWEFPKTTQFVEYAVSQSITTRVIRHGPGSSTINQCGPLIGSPPLHKHAVSEFAKTVTNAYQTYMFMAACQRSASQSSIFSVTTAVAGPRLPRTDEPTSDPSDSKTSL